MAKKDLFGREKDAERRAAIEREAAEEVERLTRRTTPSPGGILGGGGGMGGPGATGNVGPPSDLEMIANSVRERPRGRGATGLGGKNPNPASAFPMGAAMLSGAVGSGFGPAGLSPGPGNRGSGSAVPAGQRSTPSPDYADAGPMGGRFGRVGDDDEEEMSITEMALADYAARSGSSLEDVAMQVDVESAEEMRDRAMRQFHERQKTASRPMAAVTDPFAPAAVRSRSATAAAAAQAKLDAPGGRQRPESAGSALAARIAARRRQDQERARPGGALGGGARLAPAAPPREEAQETEMSEEVHEDAPPEAPTPLGRLHAAGRARTRPAVVPEVAVAGLEAEPGPVPDPEPDAPAPSDPNAHLYEALMEERAARLALEARLEALAAAASGGGGSRRVAKKPVKAAATKATAKKPAVKKAAAATKAPVAKKAGGVTKRGAVLAKPVPAKKPVAVRKASPVKKASGVKKAR